MTKKIKFYIPFIFKWVAPWIVKTLYFLFVILDFTYIIETLILMIYLGIDHKEN